MIVLCWLPAVVSFLLSGHDSLREVDMGWGRGSLLGYSSSTTHKIDR